MTADGMYEDHTGTGGLNPMPYDVFPRKYLAVMMARGYNETHAEYITEMSRRGASMSLIMQSPLGEIPTGGRSSQHQWNEAVSMTLYEIWATRYNQGIGMAGGPQPDIACMFKRAAKLSLQSLRRWVLPAGEMEIVKNKFDPALRWGYQSYSYQSQYNLLPASMVATAFLFADESIPECAAPADIGGYAFYLPRFNKVFANAAGTYVEHETGADPHYDSTGITRVHSKRMSSGPDGVGLLGPTAGTEQEDGGLAIGPCWQLTSGKVRPTSRLYEGVLSGYTCLSDKLAPDVYAVTLLPGTDNNASYVQYEVTYVLLDDGVAVTQSVTITDGRVAVDHSVVKPTEANLEAAREQRRGTQALSIPSSGDAVPGASLPFSGFGVSFPAFAFDGDRNTSIEVGPDGAGGGFAVVSSPGMGSTMFSVPTVGAAHTISMVTNSSADALLHSRNGLVQAVLATVSPISTGEPSLTTVLTY